MGPASLDGDQSGPGSMLPDARPPTPRTVALLLQDSAFRESCEADSAALAAATAEEGAVSNHLGLCAAALAALRLLCWEEPKLHTTWSRSLGSMVFAEELVLTDQFRTSFAESEMASGFSPPRLPSRLPG